jgi:hypothetical protein
LGIPFAAPSFMSELLEFSFVLSIFVVALGFAELEAFCTRKQQLPTTKDEMN